MVKKAIDLSLSPLKAAKDFILPDIPTPPPTPPPIPPPPAPPEIPGVDTAADRQQASETAARVSRRRRALATERGTVLTSGLGLSGAGITTKTLLGQ